jgi:hypothetical protein
MNPQDEALTILKEMIRGLTSPNHDLITIMRKCQHVCEILGWQPAKTWFYQELNGYYLNSPLPLYRKIMGIKKWQFEGSPFGHMNYQSEKQVYALDPKVYTEEPDTLELTAGIGWILSVSQSGYTENLSETKKVPSPSGQEQVTLRKVRFFPAVNIAYSIFQIEKFVFDWVSSSYVQLQYGNRVKDIWERYRTKVDNALQQLGLTNHLSVIQDNIATDNPESWRVAVLECRNLLRDLADHLWKDSRDTYNNLPGDGPNKKLDVSKGNYGNRISAYLHQKSVTGKEGKFLRDEAERLSISIKSLISVESTAHEPIERSFAEMVVLSSYFIIGELALKTDLSPITEYTPTVT